MKKQTTEAESNNGNHPAIKRYFSPETRAKISLAMIARWERAREKEAQREVEAGEISLRRLAEAAEFLVNHEELKAVFFECFTPHQMAEAIERFDDQLGGKNRRPTAFTMAKRQFRRALSGKLADTLART